MSAPQAQVKMWRRRLADHTMRDGHCPVCGTSYRCRVFADTFADLIAHGELPEATPPAPSGGNPTVGASEGDQR